VRLTFDERPTRGTAWSADGRSVVYSSGSYHNPRLWRAWFPQPDGRPRPVELLAFAGHGARSPAISRQGRLAFTSYPSDADIQRLELTGSPEEPRAPKPPVTVIGSSRLDHTPRQSPDGSRIAFASDRSGSHQIGYATGTARTRCRWRHSVAHTLRIRSGLQTGIGSRSDRGSRDA